MLTEESILEIRILSRRGMSIRAIALELRISRNTVRKYLPGDTVQPTQRRSPAGHASWNRTKSRYGSGLKPRQLRVSVDSDKPMAPMSWAQRLKRVFAIDICGGKLRVIACIEDPLLIRKLLEHVRQPTGMANAEARGPPGDRPVGWSRV